MTAAISVNLRQASDLTGVSQRVLWDAVMHQKLPARRLSERGRILLKVADLEAWIDGLEPVR